MSIKTPQTSIKTHQTSIKNGRKKGDEHRKATIQPTPRRGKQRESQSGSKRPEAEKRQTPPKRATKAKPRRREQKENPKQQKNTMKNTILFDSFSDVRERMAERIR